MSKNLDTNQGNTVDIFKFPVHFRLLAKDLTREVCTLQIHKISLKLVTMGKYVRQGFHQVWYQGIVKATASCLS